ncbi:LPXTG cell wall anchor domain-containing protein [Thermococcus sp. 21S7]|uniref:LPXTG cell wall anchor domain-containing protein n=1 Tax=Thermococcus sp. 21S7 TaxID=1638221 RepID=UPI0014392823|nr:LPXTG cell wall anchor domain-containing protein [Thermococcus sp. 21S7]NJE61936.1 LPXTG cell wall anchor domain-containing protein [Thermococcus sp. 21S7]
MVSFDHYTLGYLSFALMGLAMLSGALIFLSKRRETWIKAHIVISVIAYIIMFLSIWLVR